MAMKYEVVADDLFKKIQDGTYTPNEQLPTIEELCDLYSVSKITIKKGEKEVDATRVMAVMALGVKQGETVTVNVDGADEDAAVAAMKAFFEKEL